MTARPAQLQPVMLVEPRRPSTLTGANGGAHNGAGLSMALNLREQYDYIILYNIRWLVFALFLAFYRPIIGGRKVELFSSLTQDSRFLYSY